MEDMRLYNLNPSYLKTLLKKIDKVALCKELGITVNCLGLKTTSKSIIYIFESIIIAKHLNMSVEDVFAPTKEIIIKTMMNLEDSYLTDKIEGVKSESSKFNFSADYLSHLCKIKNITKNTLCTLWDLKIVSIYDKLGGRTKITLKEGLLLASLMQMTIKDIFAPSQENIINSLSKNLDVNISKEEEKIILIENKRFENFNLIIHHKYVRTIIKDHDFKVSDIAQLWDMSVSSTRNRLNGLCTVTFIECLKLAKLLDMTMSELYSPTNIQLKNVLEE